MISDKFITAERRQLLIDAHMTIVQSLKYPTTVGKDAVTNAYARIDGIRLLEKKSAAKEAA